MKPAGTEFDADCRDALAPITGTAAFDLEATGGRYAALSAWAAKNGCKPNEALRRWHALRKEKTTRGQKDGN
ncbi:hypothetical protein NX862_18915 [Rhodobacter sp. KR11]|uniref:hypothetical protein n=1 Tax=Rhodobacter sp. KR11 TaxID=2974588 RepID=UPI0022221CD0|nr:hypothetical protein [Rhodobacter sp. KR11]MCW1920835.1 hypothetical protein [Rhodobacter sp. KR11]